MEITLESQSATKKLVNITIPKEIVSEEIKKEIEKVRKKANIKGFRKGKAPISLIKKMYGDSIKYEALNKLINDSLSKAIEDNKINYVGDPIVKDVSDISEDEELKISAEFNCVEDFEVDDYKGIKVDVEKLELTEEMEKNAIDNILTRFTYFEDVEDDTPIEEGFQIVVNIEATLNGEKLEDLCREDFILTVGEDSYLPGFDDYFIGLNKDDETEVTHTIFKDGEEVEANFKIKVLWVKKPVVPELDDEFISQFGEEYKSVDDFKEKIKKEINDNLERQIRDEAIEGILEKLREKYNFQYPEVLLEKQIEYLKKSYNKLAGEDDKEYEERIRDIADKQIRNTLILSKIEKAENIVANPEDIENEIKKVAEQFNIEPEKIRNYYLSNQKLLEDLINKITTDKVLDFLYKNSEINFIEKDQVSEEDESDKKEEEK
jgi:trigger factor